MKKPKALIKNKPKFSIGLLLFFVFLFVATGVYLVFNMFGATIDSATADKYVYNSKTIERVWGPTRYTTAEAISKTNYPVPSVTNTVILVNGSNWTDATVASSLAGAYNAPILLTTPGSLSVESSREITRIKPSKVFIIGGTVSITPAVETAAKNVAATGATVTRIAGVDRYDTAAKVAIEVKNKLGSIPDGKAFIVSGVNFPDSLTVGSIAANKKYPILFSDASLNAYTAWTISYLGITKPIVVGGESSVSRTTFNSLPGATRIAAADRYKTSIEFAKWALANTGVSAYNVGIASGADFPDALSASSFMANRSNPGILLLTPKDGNSDINNYLNTLKPSMNSIFVFGGSASVSSAYFTKAATYVGITLNPEQMSAQSLLDGYIAKYPMLAGSTVEFGDARGYQALAFYQSGKIVISPTHTASLDRIIGHEIWHIIDWRYNNIIDWGENIPPSNASYFIGK